MLEGNAPSNIPIPDPSVRTTEQLYRELQMQREFLENRVDSLGDLCNDKISSLKELINQQIQASKEAINKSESSINKDMEALKNSIANSKESFSTQIQNLSSRMDRWDGLDRGARDNKTDTQMTVGSIVGVILGIVGVLTLVATVWTHNPTVGADTKRVDDLIAQSNSRFDSLSARLNALTPQTKPAGAP